MKTLNILCLFLNLLLSNHVFGHSSLDNCRIIKIAEMKSFDGVDFPLCITQERKEKATNWMKKNKNTIFEKLLKQHGAVLLRGFDIDDAKDFSDLILSIGFEEQKYHGGNAVRKLVAPRVFTSNESPPDKLIPFHHEMAQLDDFPNKVFFFCEIPSLIGGQTPILLSSKICDYIRENKRCLYNKLKNEGVRYKIRMPNVSDDSSSIGRSWCSTFATNDKSEVEKTLRESNSTWTWHTNGDLTVKSKKMNAILEDKYFFNQIIAAYIGWNDSRNEGKNCIVFAKSDEEIKEKDMKDIYEEMQKISVSFKWCKGDVLIIDNERVMHSRNTFIKPRRILASLSK